MCVFMNNLAEAHCGTIAVETQAIKLWVAIANPVEVKYLLPELMRLLLRLASY